MWQAFSVLKIKGEFKPRVDNLVFQLHYRYTVMLFMASAILATLYDFVGDKIICMLESTSYSGLAKLVNSYCYITGTYTVDKLQYGKIGIDMPHQGVGPHLPEDAITYHTYYQWVPFVLVGQAALFYLPHMIWKKWEGGLFRSIIQNLSIKDYLSTDKNGMMLGNYMNREVQFQALAVYVKDYMHTHKGWASKFIFCEFLNVVITVSTVLFTNYFLGGEFFDYGLKVFEISDMDPENRTDPMAQVFPRMGKCTFRMFGPSGTIEQRDVMCLLPTNIANEKIYMVMWFWLAILAIIGMLWCVMRIVCSFRVVREKLFMLRVYSFPRYNADGYEPLGRTLATQDQIKIVLRQSDYSDYILLSQLADNMDNALFSEFVSYLAAYITKDVVRNCSDSGVDEEEIELTSMSKKEEAMLGGKYPYVA